jgi:hypothetical protein
MAIVALTPVDLDSSAGAVITQGAGTAIVQANTNTIAYEKDDTLLIQVDSDHASTGMVVGAGDFVDKGKGAQTYLVGSGISHLIKFGPSSRFKSAGKLSITWATDSAGFVRVFKLKNG